MLEITDDVSETLFNVLDNARLHHFWSQREPVS